MKNLISEMMPFYSAAAANHHLSFFVSFVITPALLQSCIHFFPFIIIHTTEHVRRRRDSSRNRRSAVDYSSLCKTVSAIPPVIREEYSLDPFYEKYTQTYGVPIISSGQVSDTALSRACYAVRFLMSDRADIREALYNGMARVSILGINELTNEIPEYRYLVDSWNAQHTRSRRHTPKPGNRSRYNSFFLLLFSIFIWAFTPFKIVILIVKVLREHYQSFSIILVFCFVPIFICT